MTNENPCSDCNDPRCPDRERRPGESEEDFQDRQRLRARMCRIRHKVVVLSGKGGVGKSTVAVNLATSLAMAGKRVGLLDVDIHGPSVPRLLHLEGTTLSGNADGIEPVTVTHPTGSLQVISIGFLLRSRDDAVIWRGPRKYGVIRQFLTDVEWGDLDYLVVDAPPGTGDEPLAVIQLLGNADGAIVVTTPQELSVQDVRRCIGFCRQLDLPVLGVVENMSGFTCPRCGEIVSIFGADGGRAMAEEMGVPYLGAVPIDPEIVISGDAGTPMVQANPHSPAAMALGRIARSVLGPELHSAATRPVPSRDGRPMRIAIPLTGGVLSSHFGHCEQFVLFDVEGDGRAIGGGRLLTPPPHEPGTYPRWLREQGATVIIAAGMGSRAQSLFEQNGVQVVVGATSAPPEAIVRDFLGGRLTTGDNVCDH